MIFEDLSSLPGLWVTTHNITAEEKNNHKFFLKEYFHNLLPIAPFLPKPEISLQKKIIESYNHFQTITLASQHHHVKAKRVEKMNSTPRQAAGYLGEWRIEKCRLRRQHSRLLHPRGKPRGFRSCGIKKYTLK